MQRSTLPLHVLLLWLLCCGPAAANDVDVEARFNAELAELEQLIARSQVTAAESTLQHARELLAQLESPTAAQEVDLDNNEAAIHIVSGQMRAARPLLERALAQARAQLPGSRSLLRVLNNFGYVERESGDLRHAHALLDEAVQLAARLQVDAHFQAVISHNLGQVDFARADYVSARAGFERALALSLELDPSGRKALRGAGLLALQATLERLGESAAAAALETEAAQIFEQLEESCQCSAMPMLDLAFVAMRRGDLDLAEQRARRSTQLQQALTPDGPLVAHSLQARAHIELQRQRLPQAERLARSALKIQETHDERGLIRVRTEYLLGRISSARKQPGQARKFFCAASRSLDQVRLPFAGDPVAQARFHSQHVDVYLSCVRAQLDAGRPDEAFLSWERARARGFQEALWRRGLELTEPTRMPDPKPDLASLRARLPAHALLLSFAVGETETLLFAFSKTRLEVHRIPITSVQLGARVARLRTLIQRGRQADLAQIKLLSAALHELLLQPAQAALAQAQMLLIAADDELHTLPFAALWDQQAQRWLIEQLPLVQVDSTAVAARNRDHPESGRLLAVADPQRPPADLHADPVERGRLQRLPALPGARREVAAVRRSFAGTSELLVGAPATLARVRTAAGQAQVLHLAVHGLFDPVQPLESALVLAPDPLAADDGLLHAWEIFQDWRLQAQLVVLSACETGRGGDFGGEGLLGLTRAFQFAGARQVLATLWRIDDSATARLMAGFYREQAVTRNTAQAWQQAVRAHLAAAETDADAVARGVGGLSTQATPATSKRDGRHPYEWAAFVLHGNP